MGTFNVNGMNNPTKRRAIFQSLRNQKLDFCCLQETHSSPGTVHLWQSEWGGHLLASSGRQNARGVAILVKRSLQYKIVQQLTDTEGRILLVEIEFQGASYTLGCLYAPTQDKPHEQIRFLNELEGKLDLLSETNIILAGDFNCLLNPDLDRNQMTSQSTNVNQYRDRIKAILEDRRLCDIWRIRHPADRAYTFRRGLYASRLDYIFIPNHLSESANKTQIHRGPHSDHSLLTVEIRQTSMKKGPGLWRLDVSLLTDSNFKAEMKQFLEEWDPPPELADPRVTWEWLKFQIKNFVMEFQSRKRSLRAQTIKDLSDELQILCTKQDQGDSDQAALDIEIQSIKRQLKEIEEEQANKAILRSRCTWARLGEKPTGYFLRLEKQRSKEKNMSSIIKDDGQIISGSENILEECRSFYQHLYTEDPGKLVPVEEIASSLREVEHPTLSEFSRDQMEAPFSIDELKKALLKMNTNKAPGTDGLPPEFYSTFWDQVSTYLYDSINHSLQEGELSTEQRRGVITLIPKKEVDRRRIGGRLRS